MYKILHIPTSTFMLTGIESWVYWLTAKFELDEISYYTSYKEFTATSKEKARKLLNHYINNVIPKRDLYKSNPELYLDYLNTNLYEIIEI